MQLIPPFFIFERARWLRVTKAVNHSNATSLAVSYPIGDFHFSVFMNLAGLFPREQQIVDERLMLKSLGCLYRDTWSLVLKRARPFFSSILPVE